MSQSSLMIQNNLIPIIKHVVSSGMIS